MLGDWSKGIVAVVASGPSAQKTLDDLTNDPLDLFDHILVVNSSWELLPYADALYATDSGWWKQHKGVPSFKGRKLTASRHTLDPSWNVERVSCVDSRDARRTWLVLDGQNIGSGGNSGFQGLNVALSLYGARRILAIGFDMCTDGKKKHWHKDHTGALRNPEQWWFDKCLATFNKQTLPPGIEVINCSPISAITAFPKMTIQQALERWK